MNPFTESTVARPLVDKEMAATRAAATKACPSRIRDSDSATKACPSRICDSDSATKACPSRIRDSDSATRAYPSLIHDSHSPRLASRLHSARPFWRPILGAMGLAAGLALSGPAHAVDANAATQAQLESVRGIGPKTAQIIIEERVRGGKYESFNDLSERVKGIGPKKAATLQAAGLTVGMAGAASSISAGVAPLAWPGKPKSSAGSSALSAKSKSTLKPAGKPAK